MRWTSRLFLPWGRNVLENQYRSNQRLMLARTEGADYCGHYLLPVQACSGQATVLCSLALFFNTRSIRQAGHPLFPANDDG